MRVGIDLHGTITEDPEGFEDFMSWHRNEAYNEVYIISGPPKDQVEQELEALGVTEYDEIISVVDYLKETIGEKNMWQDENGNWWAEDEDWWSSKVKICNDYDIAWLFDDKKEYGYFFYGYKKFYLYKKGMVYNRESNFFE